MRILGNPFCAVCRSVINSKLQPYIPEVPVITSLTPSNGSSAGGTIVVITGSGFTGATSVNFGATPAGTFNVDSDTQITVTSPAANLSGAVDVKVTTPGGTSAASTADQFTYITAAAPSITGITPTSDPAT